jgi:hypothetical protein
MTRSPIRRAALAGLFVAVAGAAAAQQAPSTDTSQSDVLTHAIDIQGVAPSACVMAPATLDPGSVNAVLQSASASNADVLVTLNTDAQTRSLQAVSVALSVPIKCNAAHSLTVHSQHQGMKPLTPVAPTPGFASALNYTLSTTWAGQTASFDTASAQNLTINVPDANTGDANVTLNIAGGGPPLIAGNYSDEIVVEVATTS